jgi:transcriptional regulator with XRE-family HTH domain
MAERTRLIEARFARGWKSQEQMAEALGVTRITISSWERGLTRPSRYYRRKLCKAFGIDDIEPLLEVFPVDDGEEEEAIEEELIVSSYKDDSLGGDETVVTHTTERDTSDPHTNTPTGETFEVWLPQAPTVQKFIASDIVRCFWQIVHTDYSPDEMANAVQAALKDLNTMTMGDITRRDALCELASIPMITLGKSQTLKASRYEEMLRFCTAALEGCWQLYRESDPIGVQHAYQCAFTYVPLLETIAHDSSQYRKEALELAAQYAMLQTMLGWGCLGARESVIHARKALDLSKATGNILLQISAYPKLNWTYLQIRDHAMALKMMQEGEFLLKNHRQAKRPALLPEGVIGNFYSSYCQTQIKNGIAPDTALGIAIDCEPLNEHVALVEFTASEQQWEAAWTYCAEGNPRQAMVWLEKLIDPETLASRVPQSERERVGVLNILVDALLQFKERNMENTIKAWIASMEGANALKSEQKYRDAIDNFELMRRIYPGEDAIRKLIPQTVHW